MRERCSEQPPSMVLEGIHLFNAGEYFEAHEVFEHAWKDEPELIRNLYQGLLLIGVGYYHQTCLNYSGAMIKLRKGIELIEPFLPHCMGIDLLPLVHAAGQELADIESRGAERIHDFDPKRFPKIRFTQM